MGRMAFEFENVCFGHTRELQGLLTLAAAFEDEADRRIVFFMLG